MPRRTDSLLQSRRSGHCRSSAPWQEPNSRGSVATLRIMTFSWSPLQSKALWQCERRMCRPVQLALPIGCAHRYVKLLGLRQLGLPDHHLITGLLGIRGLRNKFKVGLHVVYGFGVVLQLRAEQCRVEMAFRPNRADLQPGFVFLNGIVELLFVNRVLGQ